MPLLAPNPGEATAGKKLWLCGLTYSHPTKQTEDVEMGPEALCFRVVRPSVRAAPERGIRRPGCRQPLVSFLSRSVSLNVLLSHRGVWTATSYLQRICVRIPDTASFTGSRRQYVRGLQILCTGGGGRGGGDLGIFVAARPDIAANCSLRPNPTVISQYCPPNCQRFLFHDVSTFVNGICYVMSQPAAADRTT